MTTELVLYVLLVALGIVLALWFAVPAGAVLLVGLACWIIEKPLQRLRERLAAFAEREREAGGLPKLQTRARWLA